MACQGSLLQPECERIFRLKDDGLDGLAVRLHQHQREAIEATRAGHNYVLTTGTGFPANSTGRQLEYVFASGRPSH